VETKRLTMLTTISPSNDFIHSQLPLDVTIYTQTYYIVLFKMSSSYDDDCVKPLQELGDIHLLVIKTLLMPPLFVAIKSYRSHSDNYNRR